MSEEKEIKEDEPIEYIFEAVSDTECISAAYFALACIEDVDMKMLSDAGIMRVKRIRRNALKIVDHCLNNLHNSLFDTE